MKDIYFTEAYYLVSKNNNEGNYFCFEFSHNGESAVYPFLTKRINDLGYKLDDEYYDIQGAYGYNGVLATTNSIEFREKFHKVFSEYCLDNNIVAEFTRFHPLLENNKFSEGFLDVEFNRKTIGVNLEMDYQSIRQNEYSGKNRNMINKAHSRNYKVVIDKSPERFYEIYNSTMKRIKADNYYFFPKEYFSNLYKYLGEYVYILTAEDNSSNALASILLFIFKDYSHYHLSGRADFNSDNSVNNFLLDEAVKLSISKGAKIFHLGGGKTADENDSLFKFKANFSKKRYDFYIGKKIHNKKIYENILIQWGERSSFVKEDKSLLRYRNV